MVICIDFDGTCVSHEFPVVGKVHCNKIWINNNINEKFVKPELFELIYFNEGYLKGRLKNKKLI